jgi:thymidylate synthase
MTLEKESNMKNNFKNADKAFRHYKNYIKDYGVEFDDTLALFNVGFYINNPMDNLISCADRNWKHDYAEAEWQWYLSGDRSIYKLEDLYGKVPQIWKRMADEDGNVNSNYGWQWKRNNQLDNVINLLKTCPRTRQAAISIYDAKEMHAYDNDTPCTYAVQFTIVGQKLNMCVTMRSNDLWYGFCNDQYCFSRLQLLVADELGLLVGKYFHFAHNLHLYNNIIEKING